MIRFQRPPLFVTCLALCALAVGSEAALLGWEIVHARRALGSLAQKQRERDALARLSPAPSESGRRAIESDLAEAENALAKLRHRLGDDDAAAPGVSPVSTSLETYFAISRFVEETRALALARQVTLKPEERFGMASYLNEGPEAALVPVVNQQRRILQEMLGTLFAAGPRELLAVKRSRPFATGTESSGDSGGGADYLLPLGSSGDAAHGVVRSQAFQVEFSGQTPVLRDFLNGLAGSRLPLVVRSLEVEPIEPGPSTDRPSPGIALPVVVPGSSKFCVKVDFVELLPTPATSR